MKKRQRKKTAKKALKIMEVWNTLVQIQSLLSQPIMPRGVKEGVKI